MDLLAIEQTQGAMDVVLHCDDSFGEHESVSWL